MTFLAESSVVAEVVASPNHNERRDNRLVDLILLHYTGMPDPRAALARLCAPKSEVSCHYLVYEDGHIVQLVPEAMRAWHAGVSAWAGETDINSCSIGIEIANPGHDNGYPDFPRRQIAALIMLCRGILTRHRVPPERILAHSDVAPARKRDPGEKFPWRTLAESGIGLWVPPSPLRDGGSLLALGDEGDHVQAVQAALADYGYGLDITGHYDEQTQDVIAAFQRHFRPDRVDGITDQSTLGTLKSLMQARAALYA